MGYMSYFKDLKNIFYYTLGFGGVIAWCIVLLFQLEFSYILVFYSMLISSVYLLLTIIEFTRIKKIRKLKENCCMREYLKEIESFDMGGTTVKQRIAHTVDRAIAYLDLGNYNEFLILMNQAFEYGRKKNDQRILVNYFYNLALYYLLVNQLSKSKEYLEYTKSYVSSLTKSQQKFYSQNIEYLNHIIAFKEGDDRYIEFYLYGVLRNRLNNYGKVIDHFYLYEFYKFRNDPRAEQHKQFILAYSNDLNYKNML